MDFLTWGRNPWGEWVLTHVSWSLFWGSLFAGILFLVAHATYMFLSAHRKRAVAETEALEAQSAGMAQLSVLVSAADADPALGVAGGDAVYGQGNPLQRLQELSQQR